MKLDNLIDKYSKDNSRSIPATELNKTILKYIYPEYEVSGLKKAKDLNSRTNI